LISLDDLKAFDKPSKSWKVVGNAWASFDEEKPLEVEGGKGVLLYKNDDKNRGKLLTNLQHGDIHLEFEILLPKKSQAGIFLQGRYYLDLRDSWQSVSQDSSRSWTGSIALAPSENETQNVFKRPSVNAAFAPGIWQKYQVLFRAPRFDSQGVKQENARFEHVYLNGKLIQQEVELPAPSPGSIDLAEVKEAPLMLTSFGADLAFRNLKYKKFGSDSLSIKNLKAQVFRGEWDYLPDFASLSPSAKELQVNRLDDFAFLGDEKDHVALIYEADLEVPTTGDYLFETLIDDGGDLLIDDELIIHNEGEPGIGQASKIVHLEKGIHPFKVTYYQEIWGLTLSIYYEGPEMERRTLASLDALKTDKWLAKPAPLLVKAEAEIETMRSFVMYKNQKKTHTISVGHPENLNYSYDLKEGALLRAWRGDFANVAEMWVERGEAQLLRPLNACIQPNVGVSFARLDNDKSPWPVTTPEGFVYKGYKREKNGQPTFLYAGPSLQLEDKIYPAEDASHLVREMIFDLDEASDHYYCRLASASKIKKMKNGWYSIGQMYYLKLEGAFVGKEFIRMQGDLSELLLELDPQNNQKPILTKILW
ncbi:MAG: family 16 glycoside hydrolase, partial [Bacteroidota bacterium]